MPSKINELIDQIVAFTKKRDQLVKMYDGQIGVLKKTLAKEMKAHKVERHATKLGRVYPRETTSAEVGNWTTFLKWAGDNRAFDVFQRRLSTTGIEARLGAGEKIPGVKLKKDTVLVVSAIKTKEESES